jgi:hypothetical protein
MTVLREFHRKVRALQIDSESLDVACAELNKDREAASTWRCERIGACLVVTSPDGHFPEKLGGDSCDISPVTRFLAGPGEWLVVSRDGAIDFLSNEAFTAEYRTMENQA